MSDNSAVSRRAEVIHAAVQAAVQPPLMPCVCSVVDTNGAGVPAAVCCWAPCTYCLKVQTATSGYVLYTPASAAHALRSRLHAVYSRFFRQDCCLFLFLSYHTELHIPRRTSKGLGNSNLRGSRLGATKSRPQEMHERAVRHPMMPDARCPMPVPPVCCLVSCVDSRFFFFPIFFLPVQVVPFFLFPLELDSRLHDPSSHCTHVLIACCAILPVLPCGTICTCRRHSSIAYLSLILDPAVFCLVCGITAIQQQYSSSSVLQPDPMSSVV